MKFLMSLLPSQRRLRTINEIRKRAIAARDRRSFADAADIYEELLELAPDDTDAQIQCAHMCKEAGRTDRALQHYLVAQQAWPDNADLALQLGHFYKTIGRIEDARLSYRRALTLQPGWDEPKRELDALPTVESIPLEMAYGPQDLVTALLPTAELSHPEADRIDLRKLGRIERGRWGVRRTLRGVQAIHGYCIDDLAMVELRIVLDGEVMLSSPLDGTTAVGGKQKTTFNVWADFSSARRGLHYAQLQLVDADGGVRSFRDYVVVAEPAREGDRPNSDAIVSLQDDDARSIEEQIRTRPSMIRPAARSLFPDGVRSVLVLRTDQLGDLVASIPALRRLRALLPDARIVGLLTSANADLARTLGLFDEQIVIDFPHDFELRRRTMPADDQAALKAKLAPYRFDIAIDLAPSHMSRPLLALAGATFLHGFKTSEAPPLDGQLTFDTPDYAIDMDRTPHSAKPLALVEALGAALGTNAPIIRRDDLTPELLRPFGIVAGERFIVLHTGARLAFSRWPHFAELARALLAETDRTVVLITEDARALPAELAQADRVRVIDGKVGFDAFDALLSFADLVIGNDSGPKHLAALRGTQVITLFTARINWAEWGQENIGWIISRRVPCAGCSIFHEPEECGKGFACIRDIRVEEVLATALAALA